MSNTTAFRPDGLYGAGGGLGEQAVKILENITEAFVAFDRGWRYIYVNREAERMLGRGREGLLGRVVWEEFPQLIGTAFEAEARRAMDEGRPGLLEEYYPSLDAWMEARVTPSAEGVYVYIHDITKRKWDEESLRESEERFRQLTNNIREVFWLVTAELDRTLYISPGYEDLWGRSTESVYQDPLSFLDAVHPEDRARVRHLITHERGREFDIEYRIVRPDGSTRWVRDRCFPVRDEAGQVYRLAGFAEDITTSKEAGENLIRLGKAVSSTAEAIGIADAGRRGVYLNPAAEQLFGYTVEGLNAAGGPAVLYADPRVGEEVFAALRRGESWSGQVEVATRDGKVIPVRLSSDAVKDERGEIIGYFATWSDQRELAHLEEQLRQSQKMEAVGQLAGGVAHDFNNLLQVIIGYTNLSLKKLAEADPLRRNLEASLKASLRAADLTRQLLAFGRKQILRPVPLRLDEVVSGIEPMLRRTLAHIELSISSRFPIPYAEADRTQLELVILNLSLNARDAMPNGGRLIISTYAEDLSAPDPTRPFLPPGEYAVLLVQDTGHGMDAETLRHIFEPFFTTKEMGRGTGLGLSTVYGIVRQSGGYIDVVSEVGAGTTFSVYLPAVAAPAGVGGEVPAWEEPPRGTETILLVDDDKGTREVARDMLEGLGYRVREAAGAKAAIAALEAHGAEVDLLLTDVMMPHVNGLELAEALRQLSPGLKVLFMSGYAGDIVSGGGTGAKAMNFLQKPFTEDQLAKALRGTLESAR